MKDAMSAWIMQDMSTAYTLCIGIGIAVIRILSLSCRQQWRTCGRCNSSLDLVKYLFVSLSWCAVVLYCRWSRVWIHTKISVCGWQQKFIQSSQRSCYSRASK